MSSYRSLLVWHKGIEVAREVYKLVRLLPPEEQFALSDQMRRAAVSISSNIAEGHGRDGDKEFIKFLHIARGSLYELETQVEICKKLSYFPHSMTSEIDGLLIETNKMLNALINRRKEFLGTKLRSK